MKIDKAKPGIKVDNAIIMAAGLSTRLVPLSLERPKALVDVRGEILIERQIRQLREAGIDEIVIVSGYKAQMLDYLKDKYHLKIIFNPEYRERNNNYSIYMAKDYIRNSYICSADNYFTENPFSSNPEFPYYSAIEVEGRTDEWILSYDKDEYINKVEVGGAGGWVMLGPAFWDEDFSRKFLAILENEIKKEGSKGKLWEDIYADHLDLLKLKIKKYPKNYIYEFDSLAELSLFDPRYKAYAEGKGIETKLK